MSIFFEGVEMPADYVDVAEENLTKYFLQFRMPLVSKCVPEKLDQIGMDAGIEYDGMHINFAQFILKTTKEGMVYEDRGPKFPWITMTPNVSDNGDAYYLTFTYRSPENHGGDRLWLEMRYTKKDGGGIRADFGGYACFYEGILKCMPKWEKLVCRKVVNMAMERIGDAIPSEEKEKAKKYFMDHLVLKED